MDQIPLQLGVEGGGGIKEREDGQRRGGGDYSREMINRGAAIIRRNTVFCKQFDRN